VKASEAAVVGSGLLGLYLLATSVFQIAYLVQAVGSPEASGFVPGGVLGTVLTLGLGIVAGSILVLGRRWVAARLLFRGEVDIASGGSAWRTGLGLLGVYFVVRGVESMLRAAALAVGGLRTVYWPAAIPGSWLLLAGIALLAATRWTGRTGHLGQRGGKA